MTSAEHDAGEGDEMQSVISEDGELRRPVLWLAGDLVDSFPRFQDLFWSMMEYNKYRNRS